VNSVAADRPADFDAYWAAVEAELAALPAALELEELPMRSTAEAVCYGVRLTSVGPYRLFAYLSIPLGEGPFPAIYFAPRYQSVVEVLPQGDAREKRGRFITFSLAARGQRNADRPYAAAFPGLLTDGIEDPQTYVFRGIVADSVRGLEVLLQTAAVDLDRVAIVGTNDVALLTAALLPRASLLVTDCELFYNARAAVRRTEAYPLEEINDLLRAAESRCRADLEESLFATIDLFDPIRFAPRVRARTLLWTDPAGEPHDAPDLQALASRLGGPVEVRARTGSRYLDGLYQEEWISSHFGFVEAIVPAAWK
jgi:cephalosporin-C deacetylase